MFFKPVYFSFIFLFMLCLSACSTLHYTAEDTPMINFKPCENATSDFNFKKRQSFFLWGLTPDSLDIDVTKIARENGAQNGLCDLKIEEIDTFVDVVLQCITIGIYCPRTVKIEGKIIEEKGVN